MRSPSRQKGAKCVTKGSTQLLVSVLSFSALVQGAVVKNFPNLKDNWQAQFLHQKRNSTPAKAGPPDDWDGKIPIVVTNNCEDTLWPGIATQAGTGPGTGGFELATGDSKKLWVSPEWQGRVWGRTNCTVNGDSCACTTGDCFGKLDCEFSVSALRGWYYLSFL